jgi:hypothetical protein
MNQAIMIRKMVELAKAGGSPSADEALAGLAAVIDHLDMNSDTYEADVVALIGVGSAVWTLSGPDGGQDGPVLNKTAPKESDGHPGGARADRPAV